MVKMDGLLCTRAKNTSRERGWKELQPQYRSCGDKDLSKDSDNILRGQALHFRKLLDTPVKEGFRLYVNKSRLSKTTTVEITSPSGFEGIWQGSDPTQRAKHKHLNPKMERILKPSGILNNLENVRYFLCPTYHPKNFIRGLSDEESGIQMTISTNKKDSVVAKQRYNNLLIWPYRKALYKASVGGTTVTLSYAVMPLPKADDEKLLMHLMTKYQQN